MIGPLLLYLFAVTVKQDQTALRDGCDAEDLIAARLAAGTPVEIRFALADGSSCYKVVAHAAGGEVSGYIRASDLAGLDEFERERSSAPTVSEAAAPVPAMPVPRPTIQSSNPLLNRAAGLIDANQPREALDLLQPLLRNDPPDPGILMLAGWAAYRSDDLRAAVDYWRQSLAAHPDPQLEAMCNRVEHELHADKSGEKLYGYRFELRYEDATVPADTARDMVALLDDEYTRISQQLGCGAKDRIPVIVQTREAYLRATGAAEWSGGQYDGRIHIALMEGNTLGPETRRAFAHEIVHACLANLGHWPSWLHEGLAQKLSGDVLDPAAREQLDDLVHRHAIPRLEHLDANWSHMSAAGARVAYRLALAAADALYDGYAVYGIANLLREPGRLAQVTAELDRRLGL